MSKAYCLVWLFVCALVPSTLLTQVSCEKKSSLQFPVDDRKSSYYTPKSPHSSGAHSSHGSGSNCPTPSHGSSSSHAPSPVYKTPPSHGGYSSPTPTYGGTPPFHSGSTPNTGGSHGSSSSGIVPVTPTPQNPPPLTPSPLLTPPSLPNFPPITGTCDFWLTHPSLIWGILGYWRNLGNIFGMPSTSIFGGNPPVPQVLANTRPDGYGALFREGTASLLNSMANHKFPFTTQQVKDSFNAALASEKTAAAQAQRFRLVNEGKKP